MQTTFKLKSIAVALGFALVIPSAMAESFSFGIMSDTQWKNYPGGENSVATGIIDSINSQFIGAGVDFVVQVGDLTDNGSAAAMQTRADHAQALYDAGIGFMPLRGNHEASSNAAVQFQSLYQQTQGGGEHALAGASGFSSPSAMPGLSYAFNYKNTTFVMLDQFNRPDYSSQSNLEQAQVDWVDSVLSNKTAGTNAFVFSHKGLITPNHSDTLFGANPAVNPDLQNQFMGTLAANDVHYLFGGHDHIDNRAIVTSPDGQSQVQDITTASNSYKFYTPKTGTSINDLKYNDPQRETVISQQPYTIGYYMVNVDGPKVSVDFYSSPTGCGNCSLTDVPDLNFTKQETFGYSLNGQSFQVAAGASFAGITDSIDAGDGFVGTTMAFLDGINGNNMDIYDGRSTVADVNTGWTSKDEVGDAALRSDMLTLWGVTDLSNTENNVITLSMSYMGDGDVQLMQKVGDTWQALAMAGYDAATHTAWGQTSLSAVQSGEFAVMMAPVPEPETYAMFLAGLGLLGALARRRRS